MSPRFCALGLVSTPVYSLIKDTVTEKAPWQNWVWQGKMCKSKHQRKFIYNRGQRDEAQTLWDTEQQWQWARDRTPPTHGVKTADRPPVMLSFTSTLCSQPTTFPGNDPVTGWKLFFSFSTAGFRKILGKNKVITTIQRHFFFLKEKDLIVSEHPTT